MKRKSASRGTIRESLTNTGRFNKTAAEGDMSTEEATDDAPTDDMAEDDMMDDEVTASIRRQDKLVSIPRHSDVKRLYAEAGKKTAGARGLRGAAEVIKMTYCRDGVIGSPKPTSINTLDNETYQSYGISISVLSKGIVQSMG
jgi:hypothetical protein